MGSEHIAIYPGVFDPPTVGHVDIIRRLLSLFDKIYVLIAVNAGKEEPLFSIEERLSMLGLVVQDFSQVRVSYYEGLVADFAADKKTHVIVRGIRGPQDVDYESKVAAQNRHLGIETLFLLAKEDFQEISSTAIKQKVQIGENPRSWIPPEIYERVIHRLTST